MPDRLVDLQPDLAAIQNQIEASLRALIRRVQRHRLVRYSRRMIEQGQFVDQFIALQLVLSAERIWIRAFLDLIFAEAVDFKSSAAEGSGLVYHAAERRDEDLSISMENHRGL